MAQLETNSSVFIELEFNIQEASCKIIHTNIKESWIDEFLEEWVMSQIGTGKDNSKANERNVYHIKVICDLRTDTFHTISNTGNKGLTTGIISRIWAKKLWSKPNKTESVSIKVDRTGQLRPDIYFL